MSKIVGNIDSLPSIVANPFDAKLVERIFISCSKSMFDDRFRITGSVEFKNGNTKGEQRFVGKDIMDVVQQVYTFLETLKNNNE